MTGASSTRSRLGRRLVGAIPRPARSLRPAFTRSLLGKSLLAITIPEQYGGSGLGYVA